MKKIDLKNKSLLYFIVFFTIILFLCTFNTTTSRYMGQIISKGDIAAIPIFSLDKEGRTSLTFEIDKEMLPGDEIEYKFSVSNEEKGRINEILLSYNFKINLESSIPLTVELYDTTNNEEKELKIVDGQTDEEFMNYGTQTIKSYKLKVIWNKEDDDYTYAGEQATCKIELEAIQVSNKGLG